MPYGFAQVVRSANSVKKNGLWQSSVTACLSALTYGVGYYNV